MDPADPCTQLRDPFPVLKAAGRKGALWEKGQMEAPPNEVNQEQSTFLLVPPSRTPYRKGVSLPVTSPFSSPPGSAQKTLENGSRRSSASSCGDSHCSYCSDTISWLELTISTSCTSSFSKKCLFIWPGQVLAAALGIFGLR